MSTSSISPLTVLSQVSSEISRVSPRDQKSTKVYLQVTKNQLQLAEGLWDKIHVGVLKEKNEETIADVNKVSEAFRDLLEKSTKEIEGLGGEQKSQAMHKFWNCYDYYSKFIEKSDQKMPDVALPKEAEGTKIRMVEAAVKKKKAEVMDATKTSMWPNWLAGISVGGFAAGIGLSLALGVGLGAATLGIGAAVVAFGFLLVGVGALLFVGLRGIKRDEEIEPYDAALKTLEQLKRAEDPVERKTKLEEIQKLL